MSWQMRDSVIGLGKYHNHRKTIVDNHYVLPMPHTEGVINLTPFFYAYTGNILKSSGN